MVFLYQTTDTTVQPQNVTTKRITSHWGLGCHGSGLPWIVEFTALKIWATQAWRFHSLRKSDLLGKSGDWLRKVVIETAHGDSTCKCGDLISKHGDSTRTHADLSDLTSKHCDWTSGSGLTGKHVPYVDEIHQHMQKRHHIDMFNQWPSWCLLAPFRAAVFCRCHPATLPR